MNIFKNAPSMVLAAALVTLSGTSMAGVASTRAAFTDTATAGSATFTTGTVDLSVQTGAANVDCTTGSFADSGSVGAVFTSTTKPSDIVVKAICIKNVGTLDVNYTMAAPTFSAESPTAPKAQALEGTIKVRISKAVSNSATCETGITAAGADVSLGTDTSVSSSALLNAAAISSRALTAGSTEKICFAFNLPSGTSDDIDGGTTIQGASFTAAFAFAAVNQ